jgi:hypothetical protein
MGVSFAANHYEITMVVPSVLLYALSFLAIVIVAIGVRYIIRLAGL